MTTFSKIPVFVAVSLIIQFKYLFDVFLDGHTEAYQLSILSKAFQNYAPSFRKKVAEIRVEYIGDSF